MVTTLLFFMLRLAGDPALVLAGNDATPEQLEAIRAQYGLDKPLFIWGANDKGSIKKLIEDGVAGIMTDRPDLF